MRRSSLIIAILSLAFAISCQQKAEKQKTIDYLIISGKVINAKSDSLALYQNGEFFPNTIHLSADSTFIDTLRVKEGSYFLYDGSNAFEVYMKTGYNLSLEIDASNIGETKFKGNGANENNYLTQKNALNKKLASTKHYTYYCSLNENTFLNLNDSIEKVENDFLNKNGKNLDSNFFYIKKESIRYDKLLRAHSYKFYNTYYIDHETPFSVSDNFTKPFESLAFNDVRLTEVSSYVELLDYYIKDLSKDTTSDEEIIGIIYQADSTIPNPEIKANYYKIFANNFLESTNFLDSTYQILNHKITDKEAKESFEKTYQGLKKIDKGQPSPSFNLEDINGNMMSLENLKGNVVYIDVWATWCSPCRGEIPYLKALEKEMHNEKVKFVSICVWDKKPKWEEFVKKEELQGIQVFAPRDESNFVKAYFIKGIPRFILLDQEGKIVDNDAKRPSNPRIKEEIKNLL